MKNTCLLPLALLILLLSSCLKDNPAVDFSTVGVIIEILPPNGGGLENFNAAALQFPATDQADSADIDLNVASPKPLSKAVTVTLAVDDALRTSYNTDNNTNYEAMPDSVYSFPVKSGTIPAGQRLDTVRVLFYPSKINPAKNYMLPVSIKDAGGQTISGNFGSIYFHTKAQ